MKEPTIERKGSITTLATATDDRVSLREYFDMRVDSLSILLQSRFDASQEAIAKAETATDKRFEGVNEFRATLSDQQRGFMPRTECEQSFKSVSEKLESLSVRLAAHQAAMIDNWHLAMPRIESERMHAATAEKIDSINARVLARENRGHGMGQIWGYLIGAAGLISLIFTIMVNTLRH